MEGLGKCTLAPSTKGQTLQKECLQGQWVIVTPGALIHRVQLRGHSKSSRERHLESGATPRQEAAGTGQICPSPLYNETRGLGFHPAGSHLSLESHVFTPWLVLPLTEGGYYLRW